MRLVSAKKINHAGDWNVFGCCVDVLVKFLRKSFLLFKIFNFFLKKSNPDNLKYYDPEFPHPPTGQVQPNIPLKKCTKMGLGKSNKPMDNFQEGGGSDQRAGGGSQSENKATGVGMRLNPKSSIGIHRQKSMREYGVDGGEGGTRGSGR